MKNFIVCFLVLLTVAGHAQIEGLKIMDMPTHIGNPTGYYIPLAAPGVNKKIDAGKLGYNKIDSLAINGSTIDVWKNGAVAYSVSVPSGETAASIKTKLGAATATNSGYLLSTDFAVFATKQAALGFTPENIAKRGVANGYAPTDAGNKIPVSYLPTGTLTYQGTWNAATNQPALADGAGLNGQVYNVATAGTQNLGSGGVTYVVGDQLIYNGTIWQKSPNSYPVTSVAAKSGNVTLDAGDISETAARLWVSPTEKATWNGKQNALGFTPLSAAAGSVSNSNLATSGFDLSKFTIGTLSAAATPAFIGDVTKPAGSNVLTLMPGIDPTKIGTGVVSGTEFNALDSITGPIQRQINLLAPKGSPVFSGTPTAPTAPTNANNTQIANTLFVNNAIAAMPSFTFNSPANGFRIVKPFNDSVIIAKTFEGGSNVTLDSITKPNTIIINSAGGTGGTGSAVSLDTGNAGIDVNIVSTATNKFKINIPDAAIGARGVITTKQQGFDGYKYFWGGFGTASNALGSNIFVNSSQGIYPTPVTQSELQFAGSTVVRLRSHFRGATGAALNAGENYASVIIGRMPVQEAATGVHGMLANLVVRELNVTADLATLTNTANAYIAAPTVATVTGGNYSLYADGRSHINGNLSVVSPADADSTNMVPSTASVKRNIATVRAALKRFVTYVTTGSYTVSATNGMLQTIVLANGTNTGTLTLPTGSAAVDGMYIEISKTGTGSTAVSQTIYTDNATSATTLPTGRTSRLVYNAAAAKWYALQ